MLVFPTREDVLTEEEDGSVAVFSMIASQFLHLLLRRRKVQSPHVGSVSCQNFGKSQSAHAFLSGHCPSGENGLDEQNVDRGIQNKFVCQSFFTLNLKPSTIVIKLWHGTVGSVIVRTEVDSAVNVANMSSTSNAQDWFFSSLHWSTLLLRRV